MARRYGLCEPGDRDRAVTIESRDNAATKQASGMPSDKSAWSTLEQTCWMARNDLTGRERLLVGQVAAAYDTRWEMEYREDMDPEILDVPKLRRLISEGRIHDIVAASQIGRREGIELMTRASTRVAA